MSSASYSTRLFVCLTKMTLFYENKQVSGKILSFKNINGDVDRINTINYAVSCEISKSVIMIV